MPVTQIDQSTTHTARTNWIVGLLVSITRRSLHPTKEPGPSNALDQKPGGFESKYNVSIDRLKPDGLPTDWADREKWPPLYIKRKTSKAKRLIIYYHGGAFVNMIAPPQWGSFAGLMADQLEADVMLQTYVMVPHGGVYDNIDKLVFLYQKCRDIAQQENQELILAGDSAGGGIVATMLLALSQRNLPLPGQAIMVAPVLDMDIDQPACREIEPFDCILTVDKFSSCTRAWATGPITLAQVHKPASPATAEDKIKMRDPLASPLYGDWEFAAKAKLPITLVVGTYDLLLPQNDAFVEKARALDLELTYIRADKACHVYPLLCDVPFVNWLAPDSLEGMRLLVESVKRYSNRQ